MTDPDLLQGARYIIRFFGAFYHEGSALIALECMVGPRSRCPGLSPNGWGGEGDVAGRGMGGGHPPNGFGGGGQCWGGVASCFFLGQGWRWGLATNPVGLCKRFGFVMIFFCKR